MIISNNHKIVLMGVPKTGTRSAKSILLPYGIFLEEHPDYVRVLYHCTQKVPNFDALNIEKYYVFWRDPVERFISGVNHFRSQTYIKFLIKFNPEWFVGVDLSPYSNGSDLEPNSPFMPEIPQNILDDCLEAAKNITPEQIFENTRLRSNNPIFRKQALWYANIPPEKLTVLDFANFEQNLKTVAIDFGAPEDIQIPKLNESRKLTTSISAELEAEVREFYAEDYNLNK